MKDKKQADVTTKKRLILCDTEQEYADLMTEFMRRQKGLPWEINTYTDVEELLKTESKEAARGVGIGLYRGIKTNVRRKDGNTERERTAALGRPVLCGQVSAGGRRPEDAFGDLHGNCR